MEALAELGGTVASAFEEPILLSWANVPIPPVLPVSQTFHSVYWPSPRRDLFLSSRHSSDYPLSYLVPPGYKIFSASKIYKTARIYKKIDFYEI